MDSPTASDINSVTQIVLYTIQTTFATWLVYVIAKKLWQSPYARSYFFSVLAGSALATCIFFASSTLLANDISIFLTYFVTINLITCMLYAYDKFASIRAFLRVPESTLHFFTLLGGTPAALYSQWRFRHKTIKSEFRRKFWLIFLLQTCVALQWIFELMKN